MGFAWVRVWVDVCEKVSASCIDESCLAWGPSFGNERPFILSEAKCKASLGGLYMTGSFPPLRLGCAGGAHPAVVRPSTPEGNGTGIPVPLLLLPVCLWLATGR